MCACFIAVYLARINDIYLVSVNKKLKYEKNQKQLESWWQRKRAKEETWTEVSFCPPWPNGLFIARSQSFFTGLVQVFSFRWGWRESLVVIVTKYRGFQRKGRLHLNSQSICCCSKLWLKHKYNRFLDCPCVARNQPESAVREGL